MKQKTLYVAVCGAPNVGKSTLINHLVGTKVTIVSPKPQTTQEILRGIAMFGDTQVVFIDTPGIFEAKEDRYKKMVRAAWNGVAEADIILFIHDVTRPMAEGVLERLSVQEKPKIVALNKLDLIKTAQLLPIAQKFGESGQFEEIFMVSAKTGEAVEGLIKYFKSKAKVAPWPFPAEQVSDQNDRDLAAEITREKLFLHLQQELPYSIKVVTDSYKEEENEPIEIQQTIFVSKEGHKKIIIGDKASMVKKIGEAARKDLSKIFSKGVRLFLHVKVSDKEI